MSEYRYILEVYKGMNTRYYCPSCQNRDKTFSRYIDTETGEHINPSVGRCNRESKCGYHYPPKKYFQDNNISFDTTKAKAYKSRTFTPQPKLVSFIPFDIFKASLNEKAFETNNFIKFLIDLFGAEVTSRLVSQYFIATSKHWDGATIFWQIDTKGKVRTGKIMLYSPISGKRVKEPFNHISWVHSSLKIQHYKQCLFGEHLLDDKIKPVAIVESEKTAVIASVYLPQFIWLAVGSLTNLNAEKCNILKGRNVTLFPDLNGFDKWSNKAKELSHLAIFNVSDLLERKATEAEREQGFDLADYLIKFDYRDFAQHETEANGPAYAVQQLVEAKSFEQLKSSLNLSTPDQPKLENWDQEIAMLESFFSELILPKAPMKLDNCITLTDCDQFIRSHLGILNTYNGNRNFLPYLTRLKLLKEVTGESLN
jgi:hypothetical protein